MNKPQLSVGRNAMKYPNVTLGRVEAVWNKLGEEEGVSDFLRGNTEVRFPITFKKIVVNLGRDDIYKEYALVFCSLRDLGFKEEKVLLANIEQKIRELGLKMTNSMITSRLAKEFEGTTPLHLLDEPPIEDFADRFWVATIWEKDRWGTSSPSKKSNPTCRVDSLWAFIISESEVKHR